MTGSFPTWDTLRTLEAERDQLKEQLKEADIIIGRLARQAAARIAALTGERVDVVTYDLLRDLVSDRPSKP
jgi:hypothetical protein